MEHSGDQGDHLLGDAAFAHGATFESAVDDEGAGVSSTRIFALQEGNNEVITFVFMNRIGRIAPDSMVLVLSEREEGLVGDFWV